MAKSEVLIRQEIQRRLNDAATATYSTAEIQLCMRDTLWEMAEYAPNIVLSTVTTISGTADIDVSSLSNLLYGVEKGSFEAVEFHIDKEPRQFRNFSVLKGKMTMDIDFAPSAGEAVRLYVRQPHECYDSTGSASTTTLDTRLERIMVNMTAGKVAINHAAASINRSNIGGSKAYIDFMTWGEREVARATNELKRIRKSQIAVQYPRE